MFDDGSAFVVLNLVGGLSAGSIAGPLDVTRDEVLRALQPLETNYRCCAALGLTILMQPRANL
jgi:hypothetical protein